MTEYFLTSILKKNLLVGIQGENDKVRLGGDNDKKWKTDNTVGGVAQLGVGNFTKTELEGGEIHATNDGDPKWHLVPYNYEGTYIVANVTNDAPDLTKVWTAGNPSANEVITVKALDPGNPNQLFKLLTQLESD